MSSVRTVIMLIKLNNLTRSAFNMLKFCLTYNKYALTIVVQKDDVSLINKQTHIIPMLHSIEL